MIVIKEKLRDSARPDMEPIVVKEWPNGHFHF